jgi:hypothetical protein
LSEGRTEWALKGKAPHKSKLLPLFFLTSAGVADPHFRDVAENNALRTQLPVLCYGHKYRFAPNHSGPCDLVSGPLLTTHGVLILSPVGRFIQAQFRPQSNIVYYDIDSGAVAYEPPFGFGTAAALGQWALWLDPPEENVPQLRAIGFPADEAAQLRAVKFSANPPAKSERVDLSGYDKIA